jgi:UDP-3-O-[3-hydroxymyristoyl] glucosamine N-acyltransferase
LDALKLADLAKQLDLEYRGDASVEISGIAKLSEAKPDQLAFLFNSRYKSQLADCQAAAVVLRDSDAAGCPRPVLVSDQPRLIWAKIAALFDPTPIPSLKVHESAVISDTASMGTDVSVGPNSTVAAGARIDKAAVIGAGCFIGENATIGEGTRIEANVTIYHEVRIGQNCRIHSGAVIGADGFGFEFDGASGKLVKIPQVYGVKIGNNVEIGAGTTIDRGALNDTVVGDGVKLDNQVQVGHGTTIGDNTVISGCTAIAGSTQIGRYCLIGGAVGIVDNITIADQVEVTAMSLVSRSITESGRYSSGTGLLPGKQWKRSIVGFAKLDEILKRLRRLETK